MVRFVGLLCVFRRLRPHVVLRAVGSGLVSITVLIAAAVLMLLPGEADASPCWHPPASGVVIDPFRPPPCPWCAGNRGIEYRVESRVIVRSVAPGRVTFSGVVAGTRYVVVQLANGWRLSYGKLASSTLRQGDAVGRQTIVGSASLEFFFGLRIDDVYRDPSPYIGRFVGIPRLVPVDGSAARRPPPPRLRCGA